MAGSPLIWNIQSRKNNKIWSAGEIHTVEEKKYTGHSIIMQNGSLYFRAQVIVEGQKTCANDKTQSMT
jgi:hypothetical protein